MSIEDKAGSIRQGEELDNVAIKDFFNQHIVPIYGDLEITQFAGGASNLTYQLSIAGKEYVLRRPPFGKIAKSAHDMLREADIINALKPVYKYVPKIIAKCDDQSVLGCNFYVMEKIKGIIPRENMPKELKMSEEDTRKLCLNVIDKLIELHQVDIEKTGLYHLGKGEGYVARQINGWCDRYIKSKTDNVADFEVVMNWLKSNMPQDVDQCLIHNDFRLDNLVLDTNNPLNIIGVLDWEMATIGDPLMDLGNTLAYWIQADDEPQFQITRRQPTHLPGMLTRDEVVAYYLNKTGRSLESFVFYEVYGLFRLAVIVQQIYYRYYNGQTKDKRFSNFDQIVCYLESRCLGILEGKG